MNIGRTILAALIALSVAMLPAAGTMAAAMKSAEMADMAAMADMDCCPSQANPCDKAVADCDCASMATCPLNSFSLAATSPSDVVFPSVTTRLAPFFGTNAFDSLKGSPPFRPPRV